MPEDPNSTPDPPAGRTIASLGWTQEQAAEVRAALLSFEEDWNAPGMELYDDL